MNTEIALNQASASVMPAITWLNMSGDVTITWDESNREAIIALVAQKMKDGYSFFILEPRALGLGTKKTALKKPSQLNKAVGIVVPEAQVASIVGDLGDPDVEKVVNDKVAELTPGPAQLEARGRAETPEEVVSTHTVATPPVWGG